MDAARFGPKNGRSPSAEPVAARADRLVRVIRAPTDTRPRPDDATEGTDEMPDHADTGADLRAARATTGTPAKRGRPKSDNAKRQVTLRIDPAILDHFRATGPGWQSRINAALRTAVAADNPSQIGCTRAVAARAEAAPLRWTADEAAEGRPAQGRRVAASHASARLAVAA